MSTAKGNESSLRNRKNRNEKSSSPIVVETIVEATSVENKNETKTTITSKIATASTSAVETGASPSKFNLESLLEKRGPGQGDVWSDITLFLFIYFTVIHVSAALVNHIDDTDETYGYWEPLHYLLYNKGMQTWEYSPDYAIRSYAFIYPLCLIGKLFQFVGLHKLRIFFLLRLCIGLLTASGEVSLISAVTRRYSNLLLSFFLAFFLICSPGVYFAATSFLPSAIASSLLMHCFASWIEMHFSWAIFWGSLAVLWTGWPFVGLLLLPIGVQMLSTIIIRQRQQNPDIFLTVTTLLKFIFTSLFLVVLVLIPAAILDTQFYGKWTSPTLNIALYNVFNGSGDNLYGVEPVSYYIKNLFLNVGLAWPLALSWPLIAAVNKFLHKHESTTKIELLDGFSVTMILSTVLWIGVLFSRPHKEERFMYPVYPLLSFAAALSVVHLTDTILKLAVFAFRLNERNPNLLKQLTSIIASVVIVLAAGLFLARTSATYRNYSGYMKLWKEAGLFLEFNNSTAGVPQNVCVGNEWYQFPSHFFLPENARLQYVDDGFKGILPQHYVPNNGTYSPPLQPFNDRNEEERSRYVDISRCNFYVGSSLPVALIELKKIERPECEYQFDALFSQRIVTGTKEGYELAKPYYLLFQETDTLIWKDYSFYKLHSLNSECVSLGVLDVLMSLM